MTSGTVDDWLSNPAPPPVALDGPAHRPAAAPKAPAKKKPALRPVDKLAAELDAPPVAAAPAPGSAGPRPGEGLDPPPDAAPPPPPPPRGGKPDRPKGLIWDGCPVIPLGVNGSFRYYLDVHGQMIAVGKHERQAIMQLFGHRLPALCWHFAQWVKDEDSGSMKRKPDRFDADTAAMSMIAACSEKGLFDPDGAVRGVGAWCDDDGQLVYHCGDTLTIGGKTDGAQSHQGRIYPAYPPIPHPAPPGKADDPVPQLLELLGSWQWQRPDIDPMICLGMVGVQFLGGALDWRPTFWATGARASGKSTFQKLVEHLHGPKALIQSSDTTKSGITSRLGHSSLPVALDELEPGDEGSGKEKFIIDLARIASSGGQWFRGTSDQKGASGNVYSTFFFSSILIPGSLNAADLSRLIILSLNAFPEGTPPLPPLRAETWRKRGAALKRLLMDRWPTWQARLDLWREAFAAHGVSGRNGDNWATTLAMADMAISAALPKPEVLDGWAAKVARHVKGDISEIGSDADALVTHLLSQRFEPFKGREAYTVAQWLMVAGQMPGAPAVLGGDQGTDKSPDALEAYAKTANAKLATIGLRVTGKEAEASLFIANKAIQGLKDLFRQTPWANGAWKQSAARIKGAAPYDGVRTLAGMQTRGIEVPFTSLPGLMAFPMDRDRRALDMQAAALPPDMEDYA